MSIFTALDFETADQGRDSACAVGLALVENAKIVRTAYRLIRPPRPDMIFSYIHGIEWEHVAGEPPFGEVWPELAAFFEGIDFITAHNAPFDKGVLNACCAAAGVLVLNNNRQPPFTALKRVFHSDFHVHPVINPYNGILGGLHGDHFNRTLFGSGRTAGEQNNRKSEK